MIGAVLSSDWKSLTILILGVALFANLFLLFLTRRRLNRSDSLPMGLFAGDIDARQQFSGLPLPSYIWQARSDDFVLVGYNPAAEVITERKIRNLRGRSARELYAEAPEIFAVLERAYHKQETYSLAGEYALRSTDKSKYIRGTYSYLAPDMVIVYTEDLTEHQTALEQLVAQNRELTRLQHLVDLISDAIHVADEAGNLVYINEAAAKRFGIARKDAHQHSVRTYSDTFRGEGSWEKHVEHLKSIPSFTTEGKHRDLRTGAVFDVEVTSRYVNYDGEGYAVAVSRDITARKHAEAARDAALRTSSAILNALPANVALLDSEGFIVQVNERWRQFGEQNGLACDRDCVGGNYLNICDISSGPSSAEAQNIAVALRRILAGEVESYSVDYPCHTQQQQRWFRLIAAPLHGAPEVGCVVMHIDMTDRKIMEDNLRQITVQLQSITDNLPVLISQLDRDLRFLFVNRAYAEWFGKSQEEILGKRLPDILDAAAFKGSYPQIQRVLSGETVAFENKARGKDGYEHSVAAQFVPLRGADGKVESYVSLVDDITDRRENEQLLHESQQLYQTVVMASHDAIVIHQGNEIVFVNEACVRLMGGESAEQFIGRAPLDFIHPDFHRLAAERVHKIQVLKEQVPLLEEKFIGLDGRIMEAEVSASLIEFRGKPASLIVARDHSDRRRTEEYLRLLQTSVANINDIVLITEAYPVNEPGPRIVFVNQAFERLTGYTRQEVLGKSPRLLQGPLTDRRELHRIRGALEKQKPVRTQLANYRKDGSFFWLEVDISPIYNEAGECTHFVSIERDISQSKNEETERNATMQRISNLQRALDAHSLVSVTDVKGRITYANDKFTEVSMYSREELIGQDHRILNSGYHPKSFFQDMWRTISGGQIWKSEVRNRAKDGSLYWVDTTIVPMANEAGEITEYISIRTEISDRVKYQKMINELNIDLTLKADELEKANANLESFAYSVAHDLRAPLRGIDGWSYALKEDYAPAMDQTATVYIDRIRGDAQKMGAIIDVFLRLVRVSHEKIKLVRVDLGEVAEKITAGLRKDNPNRRLTFKIQEDLHVAGDAQFLEVALTNLLGNAVKFTRTRPEAIIEVGRQQGEQGEIFYVRDNGIGFEGLAAEEAGKAFRRGHSPSEYPGTGVGLTIVRKVIDRHGGQLWAESKPNEGATFYFTLGPEQNS